MCRVCRFAPEAGVGSNAELAVRTNPANTVAERWIFKTFPGAFPSRMIGSFSIASARSVRARTEHSSYRMMRSAHLSGFTSTKILRISTTFRQRENVTPVFNPLG